MKEWLSRGLEVRRVRARMSLERQVRIAAGSIVAFGSVAALTIPLLLALLPLAIGSGLVFSGVSDTCAMGTLLAKLPYNRSVAACDTESIVRQFVTHETEGR